MKDSEYTRDTVNTEADLKGISLQKHRALRRLLEAVEKDEKGIFVAIEYIDDKIEVDLSEENPLFVVEQDKNYDSKNFTLNSEEILKSLRKFYDTNRSVEYSENIKFIFYTNTSIGKERITKLVEDSKLELPKEPILKLFDEHKFDDALPVFKVVFSKFYLDFYKGNTTDMDYYRHLMKNTSDDDWKKFLGKIEWSFNKADEAQIWGELLEVMSKLSIKLMFDSKYSEVILRSFLEQLDINSSKVDFFDRVITPNDIKVVLNEFRLESEINEKIDPIHTRWNEVDDSDSARGLKDKLEAVCDDYDMDEIIRMLDEYTDGTIEFEGVLKPNQGKSYKYRVWKIATKIIHEELSLRKKEEEKDTFLVEREIDFILLRIKEEAYKHILDKSKSYEMPFMDEDMIRKTIIILIEDCFLCFDKEVESSESKEKINV